MGDTHISQLSNTFDPSLSTHFTSKKDHRELTINAGGPLSAKDINQKSIIMKDMFSVTNKNKELMYGIQKMEARLQSKEHEIINLKYQLEMKDSFDEPKNQGILAQRCASKSPASGDFNDTKMSKLLRGYDSKKEKHHAPPAEDENKKLHKEIDKLKDKLKNHEDEKKVLKKELSKAYDRLPVEKNTSRLSLLEDENNELSKSNQTLKSEVDKLSLELSMLTDERFDMKRRYEDLKSCYDALETLTNKCSDYSMGSMAPSDILRSARCESNSKQLEKDDDKCSDSLSSIRANAELSDLNLPECRKLISDIMDIFNLKNPNQIINSIRKTEKVIQAIPRLRKLIADISALVLPRARVEKDVDQVELIIPTLKKCFKDLDELEAMKGLRRKMTEMLELEKECTNFEILKKVDNLIFLGYQYNELKSQRTPRETNDKMMSEQFSKTFGIKPDSNVFKQINSQLEDLKHFTSLVKQRLGLNFSIKSDTCLKYILRMLESSAKEKDAVDIVMKLQKTLNCKQDGITLKVEELLEKYKYTPYAFDGRM